MGAFMSIEFRCLNCRSTLKAADEQAGEKTACEFCGIRVTVPQPIGGTLTQKRLRNPTHQDTASIQVPQNKPDLQPQLASPEIPLITLKEQELPTKLDQRYFQLDAQPRLGFVVEVQFPDDILGRNTRLMLQDAAEKVRLALLRHLEQKPQCFERGALTLDIRRWQCDDRGHDINVRLVGLINSQEFSCYFYDHPPGDGVDLPPHPINRLLLGIIGLCRSIAWTVGGSTQAKWFHQRVVRRVIKAFCKVLDDAVK